MESGLAFKGRVRLNPFNHRAAYVTPEHNVLGLDILIDGHRHRWAGEGRGEGRVVMGSLLSPGPLSLLTARVPLLEWVLMVRDYIFSVCVFVCVAVQEPCV